MGYIFSSKLFRISKCTSKNTAELCCIFFRKCFIISSRFSDFAAFRGISSRNCFIISGHRNHLSIFTPIYCCVSALLSGGCRDNPDIIRLHCILSRNCPIISRRFNISRTSTPPSRSPRLGLSASRPQNQM